MEDYCKQALSNFDRRDFLHPEKSGKPEPTAKRTVTREENLNVGLTAICIGMRDTLLAFREVFP